MVSIEKGYIEYKFKLMFSYLFGKALECLLCDGN